MPQDIGQLGHVPGGLIEGARKEMAQVVREDLGGGHPGSEAQALHLRPDLPPGQRLAAFGEEDLAGSGFLLSGVLEQLAAQLAGEEDGADLALEAISA